MMERKERFQKVYAYLLGEGLVESKQHLADLIGRTRPSVSKAYKGDESYLTDGLLKKVCATFPDVFNLEWLLTGEGEMLKGAESPQERLTASMVSDTTPYGETSRDALVMRLLDKLDEKDAKIEALMSENAELRAELAMAGLLTKKHG